MSLGLLGLDIGDALGVEVEDVGAWPEAAEVEEADLVGVRLLSWWRV